MFYAVREIVDSGWTVIGTIVTFDEDVFYVMICSVDIRIHCLLLYCRIMTGHKPSDAYYNYMMNSYIQSTDLY